MDKLKRFTDLNPVLVRGVLVSVASLLAIIFGRTVFPNTLIESIINTLVAVSALVAALSVRNDVIAESKVVSWVLDPKADNPVMVPGPVIVSPSLAEEIVDSAGISMQQGDIRQSIKTAEEMNLSPDKNFVEIPTEQDIQAGNHLGLIINRNDDRDNGGIPL